jgi:anti-sigma factor RsiW
MNTDRITNAHPNPGPHLSEETLSEFASGRLNDAERAAAVRHAETCAQCAEALRDYTAMTSALKSLPAPRPRRTFQLTEEQARAKARRWAFLSLLPTLPALRIATVAVALLLLAVAVADRLTEPGGNSSNNQHFAAVIAPSATQPAVAPTTSNVNAEVIAPTDQTTGAGSGQVDAGSASESESESGQTSAAQPAPTDEAPAEVGAAAPAAAAPNSAGETGSGFSQAAVAKVAASPEFIATPAATATPTATASSSVTAMASPTPVAPAASTSKNSSSRTGWRLAELGLAMLLLWLIVSYVGVRRTSRDQNS